MNDGERQGDGVVEAGTDRNPASVSGVLARVKSEPLPFVFFGGLLGLKVYLLVDFLFVQGALAQAVSIMQTPSWGSSEDAYLLANISARAAYNVVAVLFDALIIASYVIRIKPVGRATGFWERYYPLMTALLPMVGFAVLLLPGFRVMFPPFQLGEIMMRFDLPLAFPLLLEAGALAVALIGAVLSIASLWQLKRSFSLMVEVRTLVTTGMYRYVRHPLYMSELIHAFGTAILAAHPIAMIVFLATLVTQVVRAKLEERKFLKLVPAYASYKNQTGFLWPRWSMGHPAAAKAPSSR